MFTQNVYEFIQVLFRLGLGRADEHAVFHIGIKSPERKPAYNPVLEESADYLVGILAASDDELVKEGTVEHQFIAG